MAGMEALRYPSDVVAKMVGTSLTQLDYWVKTGVIEPTFQPDLGFSFAEIVAMAIAGRLLEAGVSLQAVSKAVKRLHGRDVEDIAQMTLLSDGKDVYECTSPDEVVAVLTSGQSVFGIAVGRVVREIEASFALLEPPL